MTREQALKKIKKCLALANSAEPHEAAAAMRQAQHLMREHSLSGDDVALADVSAHRSRARSPAINRWESNLARCVAEAFGCEHFGDVHCLPAAWRFRRVRDVVFVGVGASAQVASYAYDVLARKCAAARLSHIRRQPGSCKPITKTARGDQFAAGWVYGVRDLVQRHAGVEGEQLLIAQYIEKNHPDLKTVKPVNKAVGRNVRDADLELGFHEGKRQSLNRGVGAQEARPLLPVA